MTETAARPRRLGLFWIGIALIATGALGFLVVETLRSQSSRLAGELELGVESFVFRVVVEPQDRDRPAINFDTRSVLLYVPPLKLEPSGIGPNGRPISVEARLSKTQALALIEALSRSGALDRATTAPPKRDDRHASIGLSFGARGSEQERWIVYDWDAEMLRAFKDWRRGLDGKPAEALDTLLRELDSTVR